MKTKEVDMLEVLKLIREIQDEAKQSVKVHKVFSGDNNWNWRYTDDRGRIDKFEYLQMDPRIISDKGLEASKKVERLAMELWLKLYDPVRSGEAEVILLKTEEEK